jgi:2-C-methyl-D-erythritol 4-phosphate cytidylyltransferase
MARGFTVTDEAQAMELAGQMPRLVRGQPENIKITHNNDLPLAELYLLQQDRK